MTLNAQRSAARGKCGRKLAKPSGSHDDLPLAALAEPHVRLQHLVLHLGKETLTKTSPDSSHLRRRAWACGKVPSVAITGTNDNVVAPSSDQGLLSVRRLYFNMSCGDACCCYCLKRSVFIGTAACKFESAPSILTVGRTCAHLRLPLAGKRIDPLSGSSVPCG